MCLSNEIVGVVEAHGDKHQIASLLRNINSHYIFGSSCRKNNNEIKSDSGGAILLVSKSLGTVDGPDSTIHF